MLSKLPSSSEHICTPFLEAIKNGLLWPTKGNLISFLSSSSNPTSNQKQRLLLPCLPSRV